jgi:hypothetical protein
MALLRQAALGKGVKGKGASDGLGFGKPVPVGDKGESPAKKGGMGF